MVAIGYSINNWWKLVFLMVAITQADEVMAKMMRL